jgi:hypothetical protein
MKLLTKPLALLFYLGGTGKFAGFTVGPLIFIRKAHRGDVGLLEHEKVHVRQFYRYWGVGMLAYFVSQRFRLAREVEAYREQLRHPPAAQHIDAARVHFARFIATKYRLDVTAARAEELLR